MLKVQKNLQVILEPVKLLEKVKRIVHLTLLEMLDQIDPKKKFDTMMILGHRYIVHVYVCT
jgi:hypothetical protein